MLLPALARFREREFFIDNLLVRIHVIIVMIGWTGLAPWEFQAFSWMLLPARARSSSSLLLSSLELSDTKVYEP